MAQALHHHPPIHSKPLRLRAICSEDKNHEADVNVVMYDDGDGDGDGDAGSMDESKRIESNRIEWLPIVNPYIRVLDALE